MKKYSLFGAVLLLLPALIVLNSCHRCNEYYGDDCSPVLADTAKSFNASIAMRVAGVDTVVVFYEAVIHSNVTNETFNTYAIAFPAGYGDMANYKIAVIVFRNGKRSWNNIYFNQRLDIASLKKTANGRLYFDIPNPENLALKSTDVWCEMVPASPPATGNPAYSVFNGYYEGNLTVFATDSSAKRTVNFAAIINSSKDVKLVAEMNDDFVHFAGNIWAPVLSATSATIEGKAYKTDSTENNLVGKSAFYSVAKFDSIVFGPSQAITTWSKVKLTPYQ